MAYFNYRNLDPTEFEALAKDVMERILGCTLFRYGQGRDGGIDLCDNIMEKHIVVQCKKYQQGSFDNLFSVLKNEEKPKIDNLIPRPAQYYVFTSLELLPQQKQKVLDLFQEYMGSESCIVDGIAISDFFRNEHNHDLVSRNIKLFLSFPDNYRYSLADLSQIEENRFYNQLQNIFENDRRSHPSIRMMNPDPSLFPKGLPEILSDNRYAVEDKEDPRAIREMILDSWRRDDRRHILLIGEGGIGKTVAMLTLPEEEWFKKLGIPVIYVPLQRLDVYEGDLNRYLQEKIGSDNYERSKVLAGRKREGHPGLLLLLDGFNEIPDQYKQKSEKYIRKWMEKPGVQIITTSRLGFSLENHFSKYNLQPLPYETVRSFLLSAGLKAEQLPGENDRVWKVINVPLMLTMYTQIEKVKEDADYSSAASILEWKKPDNAAHIIWDYLQMELYRSIGRADTSHSPMEYAVALLMVAPYICCRMSFQKKFYLNQEEFNSNIREALAFYVPHQNLPDSQILNVRDEFDPYCEQDLFREANMPAYGRILIENLALFQKQKTRRTEQENKNIIGLIHQNFRDALAAFYICSCLSKTHDTKERKTLLEQADYYVKDFMAEHLSSQELVSIWDRHRKDSPDDGQSTFILLDLIGRQRNYDFRELDFSGIDLTKTNLHTLLSKRLDICPLPPDSKCLTHTKITLTCLSPNGPEGWVSSVAYSPDGRCLARGAADRTVRIWDLENGECRVLDDHASSVYSVVYSPYGKHLASGTNDGKVRIWDLKSGGDRLLEGHTGSVRSVAFSPDERYLVSGAFDRTVRIWDIASGESRALECHTSIVYSVAYSPDGRHLASGSDDKTVRIWDLESSESHILEGHGECVRSIAYSPDGRHLASGADDWTVRIWDLESSESYILEGHTSGVRSVAYSPDEKHLVSCAADWTVRIWNLESRENRVLEGHTYPINSVAYSPDGRHLASGASDDTVRIWDLESGDSYTLEGHANYVNSVAYSPDGRNLASGADDGRVRIWDLERGETHVLEGPGGGINSVAYSPDGRHVARGANDGRVRIWDLENGESRVLEGYDGLVFSVAYSPDGKHLARGAFSNTVRIWDLESGECHILEGHSGDVNSVAYSPDGKHLASGADDGTVRIWDLVEWREEKCYRIIPRINLNGANFELADIDEMDKITFKMAGAKV